jgi:hypothetical protein
LPGQICWLSFCGLEEGDLDQFMGRHHLIEASDDRFVDIPLANLEKTV